MSSTSSSFPIALTIGGSDSGGGAGIQADLKTFSNLGIHGCSVITAITAQNTQRIADIHYPPPSQIGAQIKTLREDLPPAAVKIGLLGNEATIRAVGTFLDNYEGPVVLDPLIKATSGRSLMEARGLDFMKKMLFPYTTVLTPNLPEAMELTGSRDSSPEGIIAMAKKLTGFGCKSVCIKGGHSDSHRAADYWTDATRSFWMLQEDLGHIELHGSGCIFSSAMAAMLARGSDIQDAVVTAKTYMHQAFRDRIHPGQGAALAGRTHWPAQSGAIPRVQETLSEDRTPFPEWPVPSFGLYPIVQRADRVRELAEAGLKVVQIRLKGAAEGIDRDSEIQQAIEIGKQHDILVVINDDWQAALEHGARAVHLGQDDLEQADTEALAQAGILLGISTHSIYEIARALAWRPSYIAIGTIHKTTSKVMDYEPLGVPSFLELQAMSPVPVCGIGGMTPENSRPLLQAGCEMIAVISDIAEAEDLPARIGEWQSAFDSRLPINRSVVL